MHCVISYANGVSVEAHDAFEREFEATRAVVTAEKNRVEAQWFAREPGEKLESNWFEAHYAQAGTLIGAQRRLAARMAKLPEQYLCAHGEEGWTVSLESQQLCVVKLSELPPEPELQDDHQRPVYTLGGKEYVLDDDQHPTRRYAYCVRPPVGNAPKLKPLPDAAKRPWKFTSAQAQWQDAMASAVKAISKGRGEWHELSVQSKICLGYVNYANNGQLGVCLSATAKRVRDNPGVAFAKEEGHSLWRVDLAKIPKTTVLINIYVRDPETEGWTAKKSAKRSKGGVWVAQGTVKNRELFCSEVPSSAATEIAITPELLEPANWSWKTEAALAL
jgi:hypothetical protein